MFSICRRDLHPRINCRTRKYLRDMVVVDKIKGLKTDPKAPTVHCCFYEPQKRKINKTGQTEIKQRWRCVVRGKKGESLSRSGVRKRRIALTIKGKESLLVSLFKAEWACEASRHFFQRQIEISTLASFRKKYPSERTKN